MRQRTNVYLDDDQLAALKLLALAEHVPVANLVRQAVDKLLQEKLASEDQWGKRFDDVLARLRLRLPTNVSLEDVARDVDEAIAEVRHKRRARGH